MRLVVVVLLASGIVDECLLIRCRDVSTACRWVLTFVGVWWWVWKFGSVVGGLGVAHCWALRNHTPRARLGLPWCCCGAVGVGVGGLLR